MDAVRLRGLRLECYLGVGERERSRLQAIELDLELRLPLAEAGRADDLARTVDYAAVVADVRACVEGKPFRLIEAVAERAAQAGLRHAPEVVVRVRKFQPTVGAPLREAEVEVLRRRG
jgi:dihydroneopterin aldolase